MRSVGYWLARIGLNASSMTMFYFLTESIGVGFSWTLYWCAFAVYVVLSLGDAFMRQYWPEQFSR